MKPVNSLFYCLLLIISQPVVSDEKIERGFSLETLATGLGVPWGMAFLSPQSLLITEREGYLSKLNLTNGNRSEIDGLPWDILVAGQGGLLDVAVAENHVETGWIYFSYSKDIDGRAATTLARAKLVGNQLKEWQDLLVSKSTSGRSAHFAGRISFDDAGHVFLSIGDRGVRANAQDLSNHAGKILRLNLDGSIPRDNPFVANDQALNEIWSYGHRNPQGLFFNLATKQLWSVEHGPRGGDEINLIKSGHNYGWPVISYGKEYNSPFAIGEGTHKKGMEQPVKVYTPSIAPSSLIQYTGDAFPDWQGDLFSGALKLQHLNQVSLDNNNKATAERRLLKSLKARIRNVKQGPEGLLYLTTDNGSLLRLSPNTE